MGDVDASEDDTLSAGTAAAGGTITTSVEAASDAGAGADSRRGAGTDSRRGFGGGARRLEVAGGTEPGPFGGGTEPDTFGGGMLPGSDAGGGIGDEINGRLGAPGGRLGVPTDTTGTLGIFVGGGTLSEAALPPLASTSSTFEIFGFDVMPA